LNILANGKEASSKLRAKTVFESTAKMGNYIYNVGHNDFAAGLDFLKQLEISANNKFISSNIVNVGTDDLTFKSHTIIERNGIKVGVFGILSSLPASAKELELKDALTVINSKVEELRPQVDVLVMLINANKLQLDKLVSQTKNVDYIFSSRETSRTRPERKQADGSPMLYGTGIQGKYLGRVDLKLIDKNKPINDITGSMMTVDLFNERLNNLQKKNPDKPLEDVYKNNSNVLNMIQKFRNGLKESESSIDKYTNTSFYSLIALNGNVSSEKKLLSLVDQTLKTCESLDKQSASLP
jgi:2',3'-cyclic-nucleotide 2'-phosphodiesterase (5'-nucleotidase family)